MCLSASTLDASAAGPRFDSRCPSRRSGGSGKGKQRVGWQPPVKRGRWWGALLQVAGLIFVHFLCGRAPEFCSCPSGAHCGVVKRSKSGRGPSPRSGEAGGREHCYRPGSNRRSMQRQPTMVTTMPHCLPYHVVQDEDAATGFMPCSLPSALWPSSHCVPLSLAPSLSHKGAFGTVGVSVSPPGFEPTSTGQKRCGVPAVL